jgi:hypothetical protein
MPNTFVHLGIQTVGSRFLFAASDFKWIALGCIIPDFPWIVQRLVLKAGFGVDPYFLLSYGTAQASLFGCLLMCGGLSLVAAGSGRVFLLLAGNSLLHLLLDAMQIKWANGVHLFAPFSWQLTGFNLLWPEHALIAVLTAWGLLVLLYYGVRHWKGRIVLTADRGKYTAALLLLILYFLFPLGVVSGPFQADNHYLRTLSNRAERVGKYVEIDRSRYRDSDNTVRIFSGERLKVVGTMPEQDGVISVRGRFVSAATIHISSFHVHSGMRDVSSTVALTGVLLVWLAALAGKRVVILRCPPAEQLRGEACGMTESRAGPPAGRKDKTPASPSRQSSPGIEL